MHLKDTSFEKIVFTERLVSSRSKRPTNYVSKVGKLPTNSASNLQLSLTVKTHYARLCNLKGENYAFFTSKPSEVSALASVLNNLVSK